MNVVGVKVRLLHALQLKLQAAGCWGSGVNLGFGLGEFRGIDIYIGVIG